ncbi:hypothetical protein D3C81_369680 [compost metagenome]
MTIQLNDDIRGLLLNPSILKVLTTTDAEGELHVLSDSSITLDSDGQIIYLERIETSQSNSNLVSSLWFKRLVALYVTNGDDAYLIKGYPIRSIISGPQFKQYYKETLARNPDDDLSTVWIIEPDEIVNESYEFRKKKERTEHPLIMHLDRLAK